MKRRSQSPAQDLPDISEPLAQLDAAIACADDETAAHLRMVRESLLSVARGEGRRLTDAEVRKIYGPKG